MNTDNLNTTGYNLTILVRMALWNISARTGLITAPITKVIIPIKTNRYWTLANSGTWLNNLIPLATPEHKERLEQDLATSYNNLNQSF